MLKAEVAVDVQEVFQQVFLIIFFFVDRHVFSSILAWQVKHGKKTFKWTVHYQEECLWSIFTSSIYCFQYRPKCRLPYLVVGCRSCPCNLLRANMNNTQLRYRVRIIWNGVNINTVLKNLVHTRPHWKSKLYFWMRPCKSSTRTINSDRLHITNQNPQAKRILPSLLSPPTNSSTVSRY